MLKAFIEKINIPISNKRLDDLQHIQNGLVDSDENSIVQLSQSQKSKDFSWLWGNFVDTNEFINKNRSIFYPLILTTKRTLASGGT